MTPAEKELWQYLRDRKLDDYKFLRQHPIVYSNSLTKQDFFILDFYCVDRKLAIELDGKIHDHQKERDMNRDIILNKMGINVLRIKNEELLNIETVLLKITEILNDT